MAVVAGKAGCCSIGLSEATRLDAHVPSPITATKVLPNGVKFTAGLDGTVNVWNRGNVMQFSAKAGLAGSMERITAIHAWDAWDETPQPSNSGPRWCVVLVVTQSNNRWFDSRAQRMSTRLVVWNVLSGAMSHMKVHASNPTPYIAHVTHIQHYRDLLICSCQDGAVLVWQADNPTQCVAVLNDALPTQLPSAITGMHVVSGGQAVQGATGGSRGDLLVVVFAEAFAIGWDLWQIMRRAREGRFGTTIGPATGVVELGKDGDFVTDSDLVMIPGMNGAATRHLVLALMHPSGSNAGVLRSFYVDEMFQDTAAATGRGTSKFVIECGQRFMAFNRLAVSSHAVAVLGTGMATIIHGPGFGAFQTDQLLRAVSKDAIVVEHDDHSTVVDAMDARPRVVSWMDRHLAVEMMDNNSVLCISSANGARASLFVRTTRCVMVFDTPAGGSTKLEARVLKGATEDPPTAIMLSDCGDDDEQDLLVVDDHGLAMIVDSQTLEEPTRRMHVNILDILPPLIQVFVLALQFSSYMFLVRTDFRWHSSVEWLGYLLRATMLDFQYPIAPDYQGVFVMAFVVVLLLFLCGAVYYIVEVRKPVDTSGVNTRMDDHCCMRLLWWLIWLPSTIGYMPLMRILLTPADCDSTPSGKVMWYLEGGMTQECFAGNHGVMFAVGLVVALFLTLFALRVSPYSGDIAQVREWWSLSWVARPAQRLYLGPFTRSRVSSPVIGVVTLVVQLILSVGVALYARWPFAMSICVMVHLLFLVVVNFLFPAFESSTMNFIVTMGHVIAAWTAVCAFFTAAFEDYDNAVPAILLYVGWFLGLLAIAIRIAVGVCCRKRAPVSKPRQPLAGGARRSSALAVSVQASYDPRALKPAVPAAFPFPYIKEWGPTTVYNPAAWCAGTQSPRNRAPLPHEQAQFSEAQLQDGTAGGEGGGAAAPAAGAAAGAGAGAGAGANGESAEDANGRREGESHEAAAERRRYRTLYGRDRVGDYSTSHSAVTAAVKATFAEHEAEKVGLLSRMDAERRRQKARAEARRLRREGKVVPAGLDDSGRDLTTHQQLAIKSARGHLGAPKDDEQALNWVYAEHDTQMAQLQARMEAERADQKARLERRVKDRAQRAAAAEAQ